jgi:hypothetical protein
MRIKHAAAGAALGLLLAGCAGVPEIPYDKTVASQIKTIGLVTPRFPDGPDVILASSIGQSFGLIGALVDAGIKANRDSQFKALLNAQNFSEPDLLAQELTTGLQAEGYTVVPLPAQRDQPDFLKQYPPAAVDAYLDVVGLAYGYIAAGITSTLPYRPFVTLRVRLVKAQDSSVLMQDFVVYNPVGPAIPPHIVTIAPDPAQQYVDFDSLVADPPGAIKGMQTATDKTVETVDKLLNPSL